MLKLRIAPFELAIADVYRNVDFEDENARKDQERV
jgi:hypothetical protein